MAEHLYVAGGRQRGLRPLTAALDWHEYEAGVLLRVDANKGTATRQLEYVSPPEVTSDEEIADLDSQELALKQESDRLREALQNLPESDVTRAQRERDLAQQELGRSGSALEQAERE